MPAVVQTDDCSKLICTLLRDYLNAYPPTLKLFTNTITPVVDMPASDFTEATWTGYAPVLLDAWTTAQDIPYVTMLHSNEASFANGSGSALTFKGWYMVDNVDPDKVLMYAYEWFDFFIPTAYSFLTYIYYRQFNTTLP